MMMQGIWSGMLGGVCLQAIILIIIITITNWKKEVCLYIIQKF